MSADEMPWSKIDDAGESRLRPGLAGRVLAEAARLRAEVAEGRRNLRAMALGAAVAVLVLGGVHQFGTRPVAAERLADWNRVANWTNEFAAN